MVYHVFVPSQDLPPLDWCRVMLNYWWWLCCSFQDLSKVDVCIAYVIAVSEARDWFLRFF